MKLLIFFLLLVSACRAPIPTEDAEIPPGTYIQELAQEADAALRVRVASISLDSCKTCTSTGLRYVIEADIVKKYFDKGKLTNESRIFYTSAADAVYVKSKDVIVFLNQTEKQDIGTFKSITWTARQATEFIYAPEIESFISEKQ